VLFREHARRDDHGRVLSDECPSLPGCISQGRTKEEAALEEDHLRVPEERFEAYVVAV
jgi:hypothetical protein